MLHTLSTSPWHADMATMRRLIKEGDDLLLLSDGVIAAISACQGEVLSVWSIQASETQYHVKIIKPGAQSLWLQPFTVNDPRRSRIQAALPC